MNQLQPKGMKNKLRKEEMPLPKHYMNVFLDGLFEKSMKE